MHREALVKLLASGQTTRLARSCSCTSLLLRKPFLELLDLLPIPLQQRVRIDDLLPRRMQLHALDALREEQRARALGHGVARGVDRADDGDAGVAREGGLQHAREFGVAEGDVVAANEVSVSMKDEERGGRRGRTVCLWRRFPQAYR